MKKVLSASFLVILVTLAVCHGEPDNISVWTRSTHAPTTADPHIVRFRPDNRHVQSAADQVLRGSQNQASQAQDEQIQRPQNSISQTQRPQSSISQTQRPQSSISQSQRPQSSIPESQRPQNICNCNRSEGVLPNVQDSSTLIPTGERADDDDTAADAASVINNELRQFGLKLLIQLSQLDGSSNLVLSPFSVWSLLLVILEGAGGSTAEQIRNTLQLPLDQLKIRANYKYIESGLVSARDSVDVESVNALFFDKHRPINNLFEQVAENSYHAELHHIDFANPTATVRDINQWVANKTHNRIIRLINKDDLSRPQLLITNAIYFRGAWEMPFNTSATKKAKFYNEELVHIANVDMMYQKGVYLFSFISEINSHVLDMPYTNYKFRMLIVLPQQGKSLLSVFRDMQRFPVNECYNRLAEEQGLYSDSEIPIYIPRFKIKYDRAFNRILQNLGIEDVFKADSANLTRMVNSKIYLNKLVHIAEIEVNEKGTTASAASGAIFGQKQTPPKLIVNRPFAFFIVENTRKTVLFAGRVMNPNKIE